MTHSDTATPGEADESADPFQFLKRDGLEPTRGMRDFAATAPVQRVEFPFGISAWMVTGFEAVRAVLGDAAAFSSDYSNLTSIAADGAPAENQNPGGLGMSDPPEHTRLRKMLTPEFTMRRLGRLQPRIDAIITELLDRMERSGAPADIVADFAMPLPSLVICELLDVPYPDREAFTKFSSARFDIFGGAGTGLDAISDSLKYMGGLVERQRKEPGEGLLGGLIRTFGDELTDRELAGLADGILVGGHETTASMLALGTVVMLTNDECAAVVRSGDTQAVHGVIEELLRYLSVVQVAFPRFARMDVTVAGCDIKSGDLVLCSLSSANRDAAMPTVKKGESTDTALDRFDPRRAETAHLGFGYGIHRCIGSELARMELRAAYPALLGRFPNLHLAEPDAIGYRDYSVVYGVDALPVAW